MPITLGRNIDALKAQRALGNHTDALSRTFERLSSGLRINRASDDAASLALATELSTRGHIYTQGIRNVNDGISLVHLAEAAMSELVAISQRQLELATQAANGAYSSTQRQALQAEVDALVEEYNRIIRTTSFNGRALLDSEQGADEEIRIQLGVGIQESIAFTLESVALSLASGTTDPLPDGTFSANTTFSTAIGLQYGANVGDFNADGITDIVSLAGGGSPGFSILLGNGNGTFKAAISHAGGASHRDGIAADVDGDGTMDLVVGDTSSLTIYLGNGNGTFAMGVSYATGASWENIATGDVDNDGDIDVLGSYGNAAAILINNGNGTFLAPLSKPSGGTAQGVDLADVNNDGNLDMLYNRRDTGRTFVALGNGNGTFKIPVSFTTGVSSLRMVKGADVNGDGKIDLVTTDENQGKLFVAFGNGNGSFAVARSYLVGTDAGAFSLGDLNGDGVVDAFVSYATTNNAAILINNGDGTFQAPVSYTHALALYRNSLADLNNDDALDIVSARSAQVEVRLGNLSEGTSSTTDDIDIRTQSAARSAMDLLQTRIDELNLNAGNLGGVEQRLQFARNHLETLNENYSAAYARIMDVDVAFETAQMVRLQILQQASAAILAQANLSQQVVLKLL